MPSMIRLFVDRPLEEGFVVPLNQAQDHYLRHVMRQKEGYKIEVFNARDGAFQAHLVFPSRKETVIEIQRNVSKPKPEKKFVLAFALIKKSPMETLVQKATELGITHLHPVITERTTTKNFTNERLKTIAIEAAEQCGRLSVPTFYEPQKLSYFLSDHMSDIDALFYGDEGADDPALREGEEKWGGHQGRAKSIAAALKDIGASANGYGILIGPEGGFSPDERQILHTSNGIIPVSLGPRILRADTAAISAMAILQALIGDWILRE